MKKITYILSAALMTLGFSACSLDAENVTQTSTSNFPVTEDDAVATLAGIYENLNAVNANPQESFLYYAMLASDDQLGGGGANDKLMQSMDMILNNGQNMTNDFYEQRYQGINRANTLIQALPNLNLSDEVKAQDLGEAKFLRAFYYYGFGFYVWKCALADRAFWSHYLTRRRKGIMGTNPSGSL